jgi:hypothetical protein
MFTDEEFALVQRIAGNLPVENRAAFIAKTAPVPAIEEIGAPVSPLNRIADSWRQSARGRGARLSRAARSAFSPELFCFLFVPEGR